MGRQGCNASANKDVTAGELATPTRGVDPRKRAPGVTAGQRQAATKQHALAIAAINEMFDKVDELTVARDRLTGVAPLGPHDDAIRDAETLLAHAALLNQALRQLRSAALTAAQYPNRNDLAADIGTKSTTLFLVRSAQTRNRTTAPEFPVVTRWWPTPRSTRGRLMRPATVHRTSM